MWDSCSTEIGTEQNFEQQMLVGKDFKQNT